MVRKVSLPKQTPIATIKFVSVSPFIQLESRFGIWTISKIPVGGVGGRFRDEKFSFLFIMLFLTWFFRGSIRHTFPGHSQRILSSFLKISFPKELGPEIILDGSWVKMRWAHIDDTFLLCQTLFTAISKSVKCSSVDSSYRTLLYGR